MRSTKGVPLVAACSRRLLHARLSSISVPMLFASPTILPLIVAAYLLPSCRSLEAQSKHEGTPPIQVMVIGTYHMGNPGLDVVNVEADDVTSARRQRELESLAEDLATFQPTLVAIESGSASADLADAGFATFDPARDLAAVRDETVQIAYRLASHAGVERVVGIDVSEGEISFFPFGEVRAFAERAGRMPEIDALVAYMESRGRAFEVQQAHATVTELLLAANDPHALEDDHRKFYYGLMCMGDAADQVGAALNYGWYARNALIFARLMAAAEPGDRVVVVYGAGHAYWLRHFAENTPGYELVELADYVD